MSEINIDAYLDYIDENYVVSPASDGITWKLNGGHCPFCDKDKWDLRLYINTERGVGTCHHCGRKFSPQQFMVAHVGNYEEAMAILKDDDRFLKEKAEVAEKSEIWWPVTEPIQADSEPYEYLISRGITSGIIRNFNLLYCPTDTRVGDKIYRTSRRIIIPIADADGNYVAWQGRDITGAAKVKYLSAPGADLAETLFNVGSLKYDNRYAIVAEGIFDDFGWYRAGFKNAVGTFGKKISGTQINMLIAAKVKNLFIAWDSDAADKKYEFIEQQGHRFGKIKIIELFDKDADECSKQELTDAIMSAKVYSWTDKILRRLGAL